MILQIVYNRSYVKTTMMVTLMVIRKTIEMILYSNSSLRIKIRDDDNK